MRKFEYKMTFGEEAGKIYKDESMLQALGKEGWELLAVIYPVKPKNMSIGTKAALYYLKREKSQ